MDWGSGLIATLNLNSTFHLPALESIAMEAVVRGGGKYNLSAARDSSTEGQRPVGQEGHPCDPLYVVRQISGYSKRFTTLLLSEPDTGDTCSLFHLNWV